MTKIRKNSSQGFTTLNNTILRDDALSWKARGLFTYLWSLPEDWNFYAREVAKHASDGDDSTRSGLQELEAAGYLERSREVKKNGQLGGAIWILNDIPKLPKVRQTTDNSKKRPKSENPTQVPEEKSNLPMQENPTQEKAMQEDRKLLNTNQTNKIHNKININNNGQVAKLHDPAIPFKEIINYLNQKTGSHFKATSSATQRMIHARWREGYNLNDFKKVIDIKCDEWLHDQKMYVYLRPSTLFGTKFENYLNQKQVRQNDPKVTSARNIKPVKKCTDWSKYENKSNSTTSRMSDEEMDQIFAEFSRKK